MPVPTILIGMITSAAGAWSEREAIAWREVRIAIVGRLTGVVLACTALYVAIDESRFVLDFGLLIGLAVAISASGWRLRMSSASLYCMGALSGLMGTVTGVGAPPMPAPPIRLAQPSWRYLRLAVGAGSIASGLGWVAAADSLR